MFRPLRQNDTAGNPVFTPSHVFNLYLPPFFTPSDFCRFPDWNKFSIHIRTTLKVTSCPGFSSISFFFRSSTIMLLSGAAFTTSTSFLPSRYAHTVFLFVLLILFFPFSRFDRPTGKDVLYSLSASLTYATFSHPNDATSLFPKEISIPNRSVIQAPY